MGKPSYMLERGDQCEHFGEKNIKKYQFLAKLEKFQRVQSALAAFGSCRRQRQRSSLPKKFFETYYGCL